MTRGTQNMTHQQIVDRLRELKTSLSQQSSTGEAEFNLEGRRSTLSGTLAILRQILREPSFPEDEFEIMRRQETTQIESRKSEPMTRAIETLRRRMMPFPKDNIRYVATSDERIEDLNRLSVEDVQSVYQKFFGGGNGELAVVGDFDAAEAQPMFEDMFADWSPPEPYVYIDNSVSQSPSSDSVTIETPDKANAMFAAGVCSRSETTTMITKRC